MQVLRLFPSAISGSHARLPQLPAVGFPYPQRPWLYFGSIFWLFPFRNLPRRLRERLAFDTSCFSNN